MILPQSPIRSFTRHDLPGGNRVFTGRLPRSLQPSGERFETIWAMRPVEPQKIRMRHRWIEIPRRQKAYGRDYQFSGQVSKAASIPDQLEAYLEWARSAIDSAFDGLLLNWYDGSLGHYIGPHHDDTRQLVSGSPIATISLGEQRIFRFTRQVKHGGRQSAVDRQDFVADSGSVIVMPWETNRTWKHSVPRFARYQGRRISITFRAFK